MVVHERTKVRDGFFEDSLPVAATTVDGMVLLDTPVVKREHLACSIHIEVCAKVGAAGRITSVVECHAGDETLHITAVHDIGTRTILAWAIHVGFHLHQLLDMIVVDRIARCETLGRLTSLQGVRHVAIPLDELIVHRGT